MINKISSVRVLSYPLKNRAIQRTQGYFNQLQADTVSFGKTQSPISTEKSDVDVALAFTDKLLSLDKLDDKTVKKEISRFFEENSIKNVEVKTLAESGRQKDHCLVGAFSGRFGDDLKFERGTLYLGDVPNNKNKDEVSIYCASLGHELTHALQFSKNEDSLGLGELGKDAQTQAAMFQYGDFVSSKLEQILVYQPFYAYMNNFEEHGLNYMDYMDVAMTTNAYHFAILKKTITFDNTKDIEKPIAKNLGFDEYMDGLLDNILGIVTTDVVPEVEPNKAQKAFLNYMITHFQNEIEAHSVTSKVIKKQYGIQGQSINDLTVESFKMMLKSLEKKLESVEQ